MAGNSGNSRSPKPLVRMHEVLGRHPAPEGIPGLVGRLACRGDVHAVALGHRGHGPDALAMARDDTELAGILLTQMAWGSPIPPPEARDFWTCANEAAD